MQNQIWCIVVYHNSLYLFWHTSGLKVSTNERTSWIASVRWGRECWENHFRDVLKYDSYMTYCMHAQFKAALIAVLVTSWLNWPRLCMRVVYFVLWYIMTQATACAGAFMLQKKSTRSESSTVSVLAWLTPGAWSEAGARVCGHKDVLRLNKRTSCQEKSDRNSSYEWGGQP